MACGIYWIAVYLCRVILAFFLRNRDVSGRSKVPQNGAVILAGNHPNGLVDAAVVLTSYTTRQVHFLAKDTLFHLPIFGSLVRASGAIPVYRMQDHPGRKKDNTGMFNAAQALLEAEGVLGVFPEGISHDKAELQQLKSGVARIALGVRHGVVHVVPVGLNYIHGDRFRSQLLIEFGDPVQVNDDTRARFADAPEDTVRDLLKELESRIRAVTVNAADWQTLHLIHTTRRLFQPEETYLSAQEYFQLTRHFADAYRCREIRENREVMEFRRKVEIYQDALDSLHIRDHHVKWGRLTGCLVLRLFIVRLFYLLVLLPLSLPGFLLNLPIALSARCLARILSRRANQTVTDVVATYKILVAFFMVPLTFGTYVALIWVFFDWRAALGALVIFPFFSLASIKIQEEWKAVYRSLASMIRLLRFRKRMAELRRERQSLAEGVRVLVAKFAPEDLRVIVADQEKATRPVHWPLERTKSASFMRAERYWRLEPLKGRSEEVEDLAPEQQIASSSE